MYSSKLQKLMNDILYADDLVLMCASIENLKEKFLRWKEAFQSKRLKMNLKKIKIMVSRLKDEVLKSKVDPCAMYSKRVMANSVMCTKCGKWVHGRSTKIKRVTSTLAKGFVCKLLYLLIQRKELWNQVKKYHFVTRLTL